MLLCDISHSNVIKLWVLFHRPPLSDPQRMNAALKLVSRNSLEQDDFCWHKVDMFYNHADIYFVLFFGSKVSIADRNDEMQIYVFYQIYYSALMLLLLAVAMKHGQLSEATDALLSAIMITDLFSALCYSCRSPRTRLCFIILFEHIELS